VALDRLVDRLLGELRDGDGGDGKLDWGAGGAAGDGATGTEGG
jgi:hypothetical protein